MHLRFSIRDLLWLTVVAALAVGWWLDHRQFEPTRQSLKAVTKDLGESSKIIELLTDPQKQ